MAPLICTYFDARPRIVAQPDGSLLGLYVGREGAVQQLLAVLSRDGGRRWSEEQALLALPADPGRWGGCEALVDQDGELHVFLLNDRGSGVFADPAGEGELKRRQLSQRHLDIWHGRTEGGQRRWRALHCIWKGYTGALNSVIQLRSGRILLPFSALSSRTWAERGEGLDAFWYLGQFDSMLLYSDDGGRTWPLSPARLRVQTPSIGLYGGCEPVVLELADGRVWMLIRTQLGRLYESFSQEGHQWSHPRPTRLISSDSPAGLSRLDDGRIVLLWNKCQRFPYAHGGRHVLHAAVSEDEGRTWIGQREVMRDPQRHRPPPPRGDHGTAYPFPAVKSDGEVIFTAGQGEGRIAIVALEVDWLYETRQEEDFGADLEHWSVFGCKGVELRGHPHKEGRQVLSIRKAAAQWPAVAVWNFPAGKRGELSMRICLQEGCGGGRLALTDHFSVPFDPEDALYALAAFAFGPEGSACEVPLKAGQWHELRLRWDCGERLCALAVDGRQAWTQPLLRAGRSVSYLRLGAGDAEAESGGILLERVGVEVEN